jgi:hypothetical protein
MNMAVRLADYKAASKANGVRRSSRRHFRNGVCAAALRAVTAAKAYLCGDITLEEAAVSHGSCIHYVRAAVTLIKSGDQYLMKSMMRGHISPLAAAKQVEPLVLLLTGYAKASSKVKGDFFALTGATSDLGLHLAASTATERTEGAKRFGNAEAIWEQMVLPLVQAAE